MTIAGKIEVSESSPSIHLNGKTFTNCKESMGYLDIFRAFIIRGIFSYLSFIESPPRNMPVHSCLEITGLSCALLSKRVFLQVIFCSFVIETAFSEEKTLSTSLSCQRVI